MKHPERVTVTALIDLPTITARRTFTRDTAARVGLRV